MEFVQDTDLRDVWLDLREREIISLCLTRVKDYLDFIPGWRQFVYVQDLEKVTGGRVSR